MTLSRCLVTAIFVLAPVSSALATPVPFTRSTAGVTLNPSFVLCGDGGANSPTPTTASCSAAGGSAGASSTFGSLGASAGGTSDVPFTSAAATAEFNDILTVTATGAAPTDYVGIYVSLAGDTAFDGDGNLSAHLIDILNPALRNATAGADIQTVSFARPRAGTFSYFNTTSVNVSGLCDGLCEMLLELPFVDGDPMQLTMILQASAIGEGALADFAHTAKVDSVGLYDASGALVSGATFSWASGTAYPLAAPTGPAPVPEPTTMLLVGSGVLGAVVRRRRRDASRDAAQR